MPSFTLPPLGDERSTISRHFPGCPLLGMTPKLLTWSPGSRGEGKDRLWSGFRLGFQGQRGLKLAKKNKPSAFQHPKVIDNYLANEVSLGHVAGPFPSPLLPGLHVSSFGVIPKRGQPGKWQLIVDLSSPGGGSVNEGIDPDRFSLQYIRVDDIIRMVSRYGPGTLMARFDVEAAYHNIAVHPADRFLLGMKWRGHYYVDLTLPFGLHSAPYIFNSVASLVEWIPLHNWPASSVWVFIAQAGRALQR